MTDHPNPIPDHGSTLTGDPGHAKKEGMEFNAPPLPTGNVMLHGEHDVEAGLRILGVVAEEVGIREGPADGGEATGS